MVLYREVQGVLQPWLTALLAGPVVIVLFGLFQQVVLGRPWGNHPVSNRAFLLIAGALCLFVVWFLNLRLVTEVYPYTLVIGFPLLWPPGLICRHRLGARNDLPPNSRLRRMGNTLELLHLHDGLYR